MTQLNKQQRLTNSSIWLKLSISRFRMRIIYMDGRLMEVVCVYICFYVPFFLFIKRSWWIPLSELNMYRDQLGMTVSVWWVSKRKQIVLIVLWILRDRLISRRNWCTYANGSRSFKFKCTFMQELFLELDCKKRLFKIGKFCIKLNLKVNKSDIHQEQHWQNEPLILSWFSYNRLAKLLPITNCLRN